MSAQSDGPAVVPLLKLWQGAAKPLKVSVPDLGGVLSGATGTWWIGPRKDTRAVAFVTASPAAVSRAGLIGASDGAGNTVYAFTIEPADLDGFEPGTGYWQEFWINDPGVGSYPSLVGPITIEPTLPPGP